MIHHQSKFILVYLSSVNEYKLANYSHVIDAKRPKLPPRPIITTDIRENVSHRSYEATCCIRFAVLEAHWVKVNSIVLALRYPSSLGSKTKKSKVSKITLVEKHCRRGTKSL